MAYFWQPEPFQDVSLSSFLVDLFITESFYKELGGYNMEEINAKSQMKKIRDFEKGFMATHLINIGAKLGVFEKLNEKKEEGLTAADLATELGLHEPYLKFWCQTAYHFQILDCDEHGKFKFQPFLDEILGDKNHFRNYLANIKMDVEIIGKGMPDAPDYFRNRKTVAGFADPEVSIMG